MVGSRIKRVENAGSAVCTHPATGTVADDSDGTTTAVALPDVPAADAHRCRFAAAFAICAFTSSRSSGSRLAMRSIKSLKTRLPSAMAIP